MIYGFNTEDRDAATAALLVYCVWRSRDLKRHKITPDVWSQNERFTKSAAKRATSIPDFIERLKPRMTCGTIAPKWMAVGLAGEIPMVVTDDGLRIQIADDGGRREFLARVIEQADQKAVINRLYQETAWVILLVRDRLERERPVENRFAAAFADDEEGG